MSPPSPQVIPFPCHRSTSVPIRIEDPQLLQHYYRQGRRVFIGALWQADLRGAQLAWVELQQSNLIAADLRGANLRGANLRGSSLIATDLREADLRRSCLRDCSLWRADLRGADLRGAQLDRWGWWSACYDAHTRWDPEVNPMALGLRYGVEDQDSSHE